MGGALAPGLSTHDPAQGSAPAAEPPAEGEREPLGGDAAEPASAAEAPAAEAAPVEAEVAEAPADEAEVAEAPADEAAPAADADQA